MTIDFTFIVVTYNQEKYIVYCLESIKYLVKKFNRIGKTQLVICNDNSKDNTIEIAENWIEKNKEYFAKINVVNQKENVGTIRNIYSGIDISEANKVKVIAGDDMFYDNDIFSLNDEADFVITPTIKFRDTMVSNTNDLDAFYLRMLNSKDKYKEIQSLLSYDQVLLTPGIFAAKKFWTNNNIRKELLKYKYIEDYPMWHYIFHKYKEFFSIVVKSCPYVMYRQDIGVSNRKNSPVIDEKKRIEKDLEAKHMSGNKYLNLSNYEQALKNKYFEIFKIKFDKKLIKAKTQFLDECSRAQRHLDIINTSID